MTKIHNTNLLLNSSSVLYSKVNGPERSCNIMTLCIRVSIVREKSINYTLFTSVHKVQHCTGYPLIQVEIVSVKVTMCAGWLPKVLC